MVSDQTDWWTSNANGSEACGATACDPGQLCLERTLHGMVSDKGDWRTSAANGNQASVTDSEYGMVSDQTDWWTSTANGSEATMKGSKVKKIGYPYIYIYMTMIDTYSHTDNHQNAMIHCAMPKPRAGAAFAGEDPQRLSQLPGAR